jgi:phosphate transport system ATP-binding protein
METIDLSVYFGEHQVLKNVNLAVREHEITAIIGPSGSGKSSLLRSLNRLNELMPGVRTEGKVLLDDMDIYGPEGDEVLVRRRVGMVFQTPNPFPLSVFENVAYGPRRHGITGRARLEQIVEDSLRKAAL